MLRVEVFSCGVGVFNQKRKLSSESHKRLEEREGSLHSLEQSSLDGNSQVNNS